MPAPLLLGGLAVAAYALLSHGLMLYAATAPWAVAALFGPLLLPLLGLAWRQRQPLLLALALAGAVALVFIVAAGGLGDVHRLYVAQHAGMHAALGFAFAWTLRPGQTAMVTLMARRLHAITPDMVVYTRRVTRLWVGYFGGMAGLSLAVFALAPWAWWSLLANVLTPAAIGALFIGEYALRYRLHPEFERVSLADMVRAARQTSATGGGR